MPRPIRQRIQKSSERGIRPRDAQNERIRATRYYGFRPRVITSRSHVETAMPFAIFYSRSPIPLRNNLRPGVPSCPGARGKRERKISATSRAAFILTPPPHPRCLLSPRRVASSSPSKTGHPRPHAPHCFFRHPSPFRNSLKSIVAYRTFQIRSSVQWVPRSYRLPWPIMSDFSLNRNSSVSWSVRE